MQIKHITDEYKLKKKKNLLHYHDIKFHTQAWGWGTRAEGAPDSLFVSDAISTPARRVVGAHAAVDRMG